MQTNGFWAGSSRGQDITKEKGKNTHSQNVPSSLYIFDVQGWPHTDCYILINDKLPNKREENFSNDQSWTWCFTFSQKNEIEILPRIIPSLEDHHRKCLVSYKLTCYKCNILSLIRWKKKVFILSLPFVHSL